MFVPAVRLVGAWFRRRHPEKKSLSCWIANLTSGASFCSFCRNPPAFLSELPTLTSSLSNNRPAIQAFNNEPHAHPSARAGVIWHPPDAFTQLCLADFFLANFEPRRHWTLFKPSPDTQKHFRRPRHRNHARAASVHCDSVTRPNCAPLQSRLRHRTPVRWLLLSRGGGGSGGDHKHGCQN